MSRIFNILCLLLCGLSYAQPPNLIPNPGFEDSIPCAITNGGYRPADWYSPTDGTPDYFISWRSNLNIGCSDSFPDRWGGGGDTNAWGNQLPRTGNAYVGFVVPYRTEHIAVKLLDTLKAGKKYEVSFYASLAESSRSGIDLIQFSLSPTKEWSYWTVNGQSALYTATAEGGNYIGNYVIDSIGWIKITDTVTAIGGEQYFTLGNYDTATTNFYLVDSTNPGLFAYYYFDDFDLHCIDCSTNVPPSPTFPEIKLYPNPSYGGLFTLEYELPGGGYMEVNDALGQIVARINLPPGTNLETLSLISLAGGVYHYRIVSDELIQKAGKLVISK